jgi:hypothetical protein
MTTKDNPKCNYLLCDPSFECFENPAFCVLLNQRNFRQQSSYKMEIEGKIKMLGETKTFGNNGFRKREVVVTTDEQYPQHLMVEFVQDKCDLLNNYNVGQDVKISINLRGREWTNPQGEVKYFNSIQGWRIENLQVAQPEGMPPIPPMDAFEPADDLNEEDHDDLPF